jgi:hypothetical protein
LDQASGEYLPIDPAMGATASFDYTGFDDVWETVLEVAFSQDTLDCGGKLF